MGADDSILGMLQPLKNCPFCGGEAELKVTDVSGGSDGYFSGWPERTVICMGCKSKGRSISFNHYNKFTTYSVQEFRNNPSLRASEDDRYEAYVKKHEAMAIECWNRRI